MNVREVAQGLGEPLFDSIVYFGEVTNPIIPIMSLARNLESKNKIPIVGKYMDSVTDVATLALAGVDAYIQVSTGRLNPKALVADVAYVFSKAGHLMKDREDNHN